MMIFHHHSRNGHVIPPLKQTKKYDQTDEKIIINYLQNAEVVGTAASKIGVVLEPVSGPQHVLEPVSGPQHVT